jgi:hypothetical protein
MAKKNVNEVAAMPQCKVYDVECKGEEIEQPSSVIKILVFSNQPTLLEKAERIFHRDMSSQLIHCFRAHGVVVAYLRPLNLFNPSECLSFYHYHLDRSLQSKATIYLSTHSTKGGQR